MNAVRTHLSTAHRFLARHSFYALAFSTILALVAFKTRPRTGFYNYKCLPWNLALAWIPYLCGMCADLLARIAPSRRLWLIVPGAAWLAFLPNAPYLVTDFIHMRWGASATPYYDIGMLTAFAWTGFLLGVVSMDVMHSLVRRHTSAVVGWFFAVASSLLCGMGIYIGRYLRLNSWEVVTNPQGISTPILQAVTNPAGRAHAVTISLIYGAVMFACYATFVSVRHSADACRPADSTQPGSPLSEPRP